MVSKEAKEAENEVKDIGIFVGNKVRAVRESNNISQEALAEDAGFHRTYISHIECATRNITVYSLVRIARALKVKPSTLLEGLK